MLEKQRIPLSKIYVPAKRAKTLNPEKIEPLAESILEHGQSTPVRLRADGERYVLIEGLHRLEAVRALGEQTIEAFVVGARLH
jgi:sulfiredoxin